MEKFRRGADAALAAGDEASARAILATVAYHEHYCRDHR
jgi:phage shock protein A